MALILTPALKVKSFAWSYSKLKNFETCPKRYYEIDVNKRFKEQVVDGSPLHWGNRVHEAMAAALQTGAALPIEMQDYQTWVDYVKSLPGKLLIEQKYAITEQFDPTEYFAKNVWYRGIADVLALDNATGVCFVIDWKTGKVAREPPVQLKLMAQCIYSHYPSIKRVCSQFIWLQEGTTTTEILYRQDVADEWVGLIRRVKELETAHKKDEFPAKPGKVCRSWCAVTSCPFHGKGGY